MDQGLGSGIWIGDWYWGMGSKIGDRDWSLELGDWDWRLELGIGLELRLGLGLEIGIGAWD